MSPSKGHNPIAFERSFYKQSCSFQLAKPFSNVHYLIPQIILPTKQYGQQDIGLKLFLSGKFYFTDIYQGHFLMSYNTLHPPLPKYI